MVISALRLAALGDINPTDITWTNVAPGLWTSAEVTIGVVSANLPFMRPILGKLYRKARDLHASYKDTDNQAETEDKQTLRGQGFARIMPRDGKARSLMGLTSTAQPGRPGSDALDFELGMPMHGIAVRTEVEYRIEEMKAEREIREPPRLLVRDGFGKPHGWVDPLEHSSSRSMTSEEY